MSPFISRPARVCCAVFSLVIALQSANLAHAQLTTPFIRVLYTGTFGGDVTSLQQILHNQGYLSVAPTGYFGPLTQAAVMQFQAAHGLEAVGTVGPLTRAILNNPSAIAVSNTSSNTNTNSASVTSTNAPSSLFSRVLYVGTSGSDVTSLQQILRSEGYLPVDPTGYFGPLTAQAVMRFQAAHGLEAVGTTGPLTRSLLSNVLAGNTPVSQSNSSSNDTSHSSSSSNSSSSGASVSHTFPTITLRTDTAAVNSGGSATISWSTTDATNCTATGNWSGEKSTSGSLRVTNITADRLFQLNCTNGDETATAQLIVTALAPDSPSNPGISTSTPITPVPVLSQGTPSVSPPPVTQGIDISNFPTSVLTNDETTVGLWTPPAAKSNEVSLSASSYWVPAGTPTTISWNTAGQTCTGNGGTGDWKSPKTGSSSEAFTLNASTDFQLVCTNSSGIKSYPTIRIIVTPGVVPPPIQGAAYIPDNLDYSSLVRTAHTTHHTGEGAPDVVGAFRFICNPSHELYDDPMVYPGQPGASHLHEFFGNTLTNANSTYQTLRTTGDSTCNNPLNRSAYWQPAMLNGQGKVVRPDIWSIYYKRYPINSPGCHIFGKDCVNIPQGLRFIFGYDLLTQTQPTGDAHILCIDRNAHSKYKGTDIKDVAAHCPVGNQLEIRISAPACWDGVNLDSPNHRSHVSYRVHDSTTGGNYCPPTHPYIIPTFTLAAFYTVTPDISTWHLASDALVPGARPGTTFHADFFSAWDDKAEQTWSDNCLNRFLSCSGGDLGDGTIMKMFSGFKWAANPQVVDPPPLSHGSMTMGREM